MQKSVNQNQAKLWAILVGYVIGYITICSADNMLFLLGFKLVRLVFYRFNAYF